MSDFCLGPKQQCVSESIFSDILSPSVALSQLDPKNVSKQFNFQDFHGQLVTVAFNKTSEGNCIWGGTIFSGGLIHIWGLSDYLGHMMD